MNFRNIFYKTYLKKLVDMLDFTFLFQFVDLFAELYKKYVFCEIYEIQFKSNIRLECINRFEVDTVQKHTFIASIDNGSIRLKVQQNINGFMFDNYPGNYFDMIYS